MILIFIFRICDLNETICLEYFTYEKFSYFFEKINLISKHQTKNLFFAKNLMQKSK